MATIPAGTNLGTVATITGNIARSGTVWTDGDPATIIGAGTTVNAVTGDSNVLNLRTLTMDNQFAQVDLTECFVTLRELGTGAGGSTFRRGTWNQTGGSLIISGNSVDAATTFRTLSGDGNITAAANALNFNAIGVYIDAEPRYQALLNFRRHIPNLTGSTVGSRVVTYFPAGVSLVGTSFAVGDDGNSLARFNGGQSSNFRITQSIPGTNVNYTPWWGINAPGWNATGAVNWNLTSAGNPNGHTLYMFNCTFPATLDISTRNSNVGTSLSQLVQAWSPQINNAATQLAITETVSIDFYENPDYFRIPASYSATSPVPTDEPLNTTGFSNASGDSFGFRGNSISYASNSQNDTTALTTAITNTNYRFRTWPYRIFDNTGDRIVYQTTSTPLSTTNVYEFTERSIINVDDEIFDTLTILESTALNFAPPVGTGTLITNTDEVYAASKRLNYDELNMPWEIDTIATVNPGTPNGDRRTDTTTPTTGVWYRLKPGITLNIDNTVSYSETLTKDTNGDITGGSVTINSSMLEVGPALRPIRLDNGRQLTGTFTDTDIGLDTAIIDDYRPGAVATRPTEFDILLPGSLAGSEYEIFIGNEVIPIDLTGFAATGTIPTNGLRISLTTDSSDTSRIFVRSENITNTWYTHTVSPDRRHTIGAYTPFLETALNTEPKPPIQVLTAVDSGAGAFQIPPDTNITGRTMTVAATDDASNRTQFMINGCPRSNWADEAQTSTLIGSARASQNYITSMRRAMVRDASLPDSGSFNTFDVCRSVDLGGDFRAGRYVLNDVLTGTISSGAGIQKVSGLYEVGDNPGFEAVITVNGVERAMTVREQTNITTTVSSAQLGLENQVETQYRTVGVRVVSGEAQDLTPVLDGITDLETGQTTIVTGQTRIRNAIEEI